MVRNYLLATLLLLTALSGCLADEASPEPDSESRSTSPTNQRLFLTVLEVRGEQFVRNDNVVHQPGTFLSVPDFVSEEEHPGYLTALDQLLAWSKQINFDVELVEDPAFGYFVQGIGPVMAADDFSTLWSYAVNGVDAQLGISTQPIVEGDVVRYTLTSFEAEDPVRDYAFLYEERTLGSTVIATQNQTIQLTMTGPTPATLALRSGDEVQSVDASPGVPFNYTLPGIGVSNLTIELQTGTESSTYGPFPFNVLLPVEFSSEPAPLAGANEIELQFLDTTQFLSIVDLTCAFEHPGYFTVHDAMAQLRFLELLTYEGECSDSLGYNPTTIQGEEAATFWCYELDGEAADLGMSAQPMIGARLIEWQDCTVGGLLPLLG